MKKCVLFLFLIFFSFWIFSCSSSEKKQKTDTKNQSPSASSSSEKKETRKKAQKKAKEKTQAKAEEKTQAKTKTEELSQEAEPSTQKSQGTKKQNQEKTKELTTELVRKIANEMAKEVAKEVTKEVTKEVKQEIAREVASVKKFKEDSEEKKEKMDGNQEGKTKNMKEKEEDRLKSMWEFKISKEEKKDFQKKLNLSKKKVELLFLPMIQYEKGKLKQILDVTYKAAQQEVQNIHPFISSKNTFYKVNLNFDSSSSPEVLFSSPPLSSSHFYKLEDQEKEKKNNEAKYIKNKIWPSSFEEVSKNEGDSEFNRNSKNLPYLESIRSPPPSSLNFFIENFFDFQREEYDLEKLVHFIVNQSNKKAFDLLKTLNAFVEIQLMDWEISAKKKRKRLYSIFRIQALCRIRMKLVSAQSGLTLWKETKEGKIFNDSKRFMESSREKLLLTHFSLTQRSLWEAFGKLLPSLVEAIEKLTWKGKIALIFEDKIYINGGKDSGIQIGDVLKTFHKEKEIFDPETGEFLGKTEGSMKGLLRVIRHFGSNGSVATIQSGSDFKANDRVVLF